MKSENYTVHDTETVVRETRRRVKIVRCSDGFRVERLKPTPTGKGWVMNEQLGPFGTRDEAMANT